MTEDIEITEKDIPEALLYMVCDLCGNTHTTPSDNILVKTGCYTCPDCEVPMDAIARYEKTEVDLE